MVYVLVAIPLISAGICHYIAGRKNLSKSLWGGLGAIFGPLAIPFVMFAKRKDPSDV